MRECLSHCEGDWSKLFVLILAASSASEVKRSIISLSCPRITDMLSALSNRALCVKRGLDVVSLDRYLSMAVG